MRISPFQFKQIKTNTWHNTTKTIWAEGRAPVGLRSQEFVVECFSLIHIGGYACTTKTCMLQVEEHLTCSY